MSLLITTLWGPVRLQWWWWSGDTENEESVGAHQYPFFFLVQQSRLRSRLSWQSCCGCSLSSVVWHQCPWNVMNFSIQGLWCNTHFISRNDISPSFFQLFFQLMNEDELTSINGIYFGVAETTSWTLWNDTIAKLYRQRKPMRGDRGQNSGPRSRRRT